MLDLKVFTHKYVSQAEILKHMVSQSREIKSSKEQIDIDPIKSYYEYIKTNMNESIKFKDVDKIFEFKSVDKKDDYKNDPYDTDEENKIFNQIKQYLEDNKIDEYDSHDLSNAFYFIQNIRRNQQLEEEITFFRNKVKDFKEKIEENYPKQKYYHLYPSAYPLVYPWMSNVYYLCATDYYFYSQYIKSNLEMPPEIQTLFDEIINKYKIIPKLRPLLVDLFFCGVIPLDATIQKKPLELIIHKSFISLHMYDKVPISNIIDFIKEHKNYIDKFNKEKEKENEYKKENKKKNKKKKESENEKYIGIKRQRNLDIFDHTNKYNYCAPTKSRISIKAIGNVIKHRYEKEIKIETDTPKRIIKDITKRINAIFKIKK